MSVHKTIQQSTMQLSRSQFESVEGWERYHAIKHDTLGGMRALLALMCHNCCKFNGVGSEYAEFSRQYERFVDESFEEIIGVVRQPDDTAVEVVKGEGEVEGEGKGGDVESEGGGNDHEGGNQEAAAVKEEVVKKEVSGRQSKVK